MVYFHFKHHNLLCVARLQEMHPINKITLESLCWGITVNSYFDGIADSQRNMTEMTVRWKCAWN